MYYFEHKQFTENGKQKHIHVEIRLSDPCGNGHQDFAITSSVYSHPTKENDRYFESGGCNHDEILKHFPEFQSFVNLHLCDYKGRPMYCVANGLYHLRNGFNSLKPDNPKFAQKFQAYYRLTPTQYKGLLTSENQLEFAILLKELGILEQWENEANEAIKQLEELTGQKFVVDSVKTNYVEPDNEKVKEFQERRKV